jgi:hypothetical protein
VGDLGRIHSVWGFLKLRNSKACFMFSMHTSNQGLRAIEVGVFAFGYNFHMGRTEMWRIKVLFNQVALFSFGS